MLYVQEASEQATSDKKYCSTCELVQVVMRWGMGIENKKPISNL